MLSSLPPDDRVTLMKASNHPIKLAKKPETAGVRTGERWRARSRALALLLARELGQRRRCGGQAGRERRRVCMEMET